MCADDARRTSAAVRGYGAEGPAFTGITVSRPSGFTLGLHGPRDAVDTCVGLTAVHQAPQRMTVVSLSCGGVVVTLGAAGSASRFPAGIVALPVAPSLLSSSDGFCPVRVRGPAAEAATGTVRDGDRVLAIAFVAPQHRESRGAVGTSSGLALSASVVQRASASAVGMN